MHKIKTYFAKHNMHLTLCNRLVHRESLPEEGKCRRCENYELYDAINIDDGLGRVLFMFRGTMYEMNIHDDMTISLYSSIYDSDILDFEIEDEDGTNTVPYSGPFTKLVDAVKLYVKSNIRDSVTLSEFLVNTNIMVSHD